MRGNNLRKNYNLDPDIVSEEFVKFKKLNKLIKKI